MNALRTWFDFLFPLRTDESLLRGIAPDTFAALLHPTVVLKTETETIALLPFHQPAVRAAIHEAKYHGNEQAFGLLSSVLSEYLLDSDGFAPLQSRASLVPMPLGKRRLKERGFNQAEEVVHRAAKILGCAVESTLLIRTRETASQVSLPRQEREANMRGAFGAAHPADPSRTYILIDDVVTTGATLQAAVDALRAAGAKNIIPLALAH